MRNVLTKLVAGTVVAGAALALAACGGSETANTADNTMMMDNSMDSMSTTNDMTAVDGAMDSNMAMDNMAMGNDTMGGNMAMDNASNAM